ncbi:hypothetical protein NP233_g6773 [Leucocoprinus birnbaumii]|uniref:NADP-dependent oxidoreductase domain-containing protein n=1 Tax=Leucocoprinus birnbaumii TaxID=56174 RepID=A0AAD5YQM5_9AGAR|nr:hypothetical protein NP233_g6773 [Leucocoprinus birnbaumii]
MFFKTVFMATLLAVAIAQGPRTCYKGLNGVGAGPINDCCQFINTFCNDASLTQTPVRIGDATSRCFNLPGGDRCDFIAYNTYNQGVSPSNANCKTVLEDIGSKCILLLDGTSMPWFAWGNGTGVNGSDDALQKTTLAIQNGINHIDTAQLYKAERETGEAIKRAGVPKDQVYVTSKLSWDADDQTVPLNEVRSRIEGSLERLGFIPDLYLIHNPFIAAPGDLKKMWQVFEDLKDEGKLKSIGVSNFRPQDLEAILDGAKHKPVANQLEFHPYVIAHLEPVLELQKKHRIVTQSYGTLTPLLRHPTGGPLKPVLTNIATRLSKESGELIDEAIVLLLWARSQGVVVVSTSGNPQRLKRYGEVARLPQLLTPADIELITTTGRTIHFRNYSEHMEKEFPLPNLPSQ